MAYPFSNTPELCMNWETYNYITGQTRNPYDLKRTSGGSSGGEAALLGAGASLMGLTSDVAGSARLPAMWCGVYGHKPTPHAVSPAGHCPGSDAPNWGDFFTTAPMCRYAEDLPLLLECIRDPNGPELTLKDDVNIEELNYFFMPNDGPSGLCQDIDSEMAAAIERVCKHFNAKQVKLDLMKWSLDISSSAMLRLENVESIYFPNVEGEVPRNSNTEIFKYMCGLSDFTFSSVMYAPLQFFIRECVPNSQKKKLENITQTLKGQFAVSFCFGL
jgi:fatty acid amide hydrolase 2